MNPIYNIFGGFCLCDIQNQLQQMMPVSERSQYKHQKQVKAIYSYDFSKHQEKLKAKLLPLLGTGLSFVYAKKKANVCKTRRVSKRRTRSIGVTKNSVNYQTVIVAEGKKTYVGSFPLEIDAAITFDFYSMMLHNNKAPTNFSWRAEDVFEMLKNFNQNGGVFEASHFRDILS
ncbi:unnamed protein product [Moneuplotes crassus]|uniref:Uncharacterized protein n=1 Tax=Euplotes crassus TaxID=5936 RepID=A0AAD1X9X2_EUPCR|nr:unnamed protein product [Moneuplotes crassus]